MEAIRSNRRLLTSTADVSVRAFPIYRSAPELEVRLEDFEIYAIRRLRVLKGISDGLSRGKKPDDMHKLFKELWNTNMKHPVASEAEKKDIISHFVLRLVYCREEELRKWFLSMETTMFRYRFQQETPEVQRAIMMEFNLPYKALSNAEYENVKDKLNQVVRSTNSSSSGGDALYYKVPFEQVPDLVASRRVFILKGYAYVASNQVVSLLTVQYRSHLSKALVLTNSSKQNELSVSKNEEVSTSEHVRYEDFAKDNYFNYLLEDEVSTNVAESTSSTVGCIVHNEPDQVKVNIDDVPDQVKEKVDESISSPTTPIAESISKSEDKSSVGLEKFVSVGTN